MVLLEPALRISEHVVDFMLRGRGRPSWRSYGEGGWEVSFTAHRRAKWVTLRAEQWAIDTKRDPETGRETTRTPGKAVMVTLNEGDAREFLRALLAVFPDETEKGDHGGVE